MVGLGFLRGNCKKFWHNFDNRGYFILQFKPALEVAPYVIGAVDARASPERLSGY